MELEYSFDKPAIIKEWNKSVRAGSFVPIGHVILTYEEIIETKEDNGNKKGAKLQRLKAAKAGVVDRLLVSKGDTVRKGTILLLLGPCKHPTVMRDMCAECGMDLRKLDEPNQQTASVSMVHSVPELRVSMEQAQKLGKVDEDRLLEKRKLVLLVDLDQTLIHTTNDNVPNNLKDVFHFQLWGHGTVWYHTRLRPHTHKFLDNISKLYELHICTFGTRQYACTIAQQLDPFRKLFSDRILSRDECFSQNSKTANLKELFPRGDHMVCIIDDREDVWNFAPNLIHVKPYHFFRHTGDINAPPGLAKKDQDDKTGFQFDGDKFDSSSEPKSNEVAKVDPENSQKLPEVEPTNAEKVTADLNLSEDDSDNNDSGKDEAAIDADMEESNEEDNQRGDQASNEDNPKVDNASNEDNQKVDKAANVEDNLKMDTTSNEDNQKVEKVDNDPNVEDNQKMDTSSNEDNQKVEKVDNASNVENNQKVDTTSNVEDNQKVDTTSNVENNEKVDTTSNVEDNQKVEKASNEHIQNVDKASHENDNQKVDKASGVEDNQKVDKASDNQRDEETSNSSNVPSSVTVESTPAQENDNTTPKEVKALPSDDKQSNEDSKSKSSDVIDSSRTTTQEFDKNVENENNKTLEMDSSPSIQASAATPQPEDGSNKSITEQSSSSKKSDSAPKLLEVEDEDDYLLYLEQILNSIHDAFYSLYDDTVKRKEPNVPDVKSVIPYVRKKVFEKSVSIVFSGVVPTHVPLKNSKAYQIALNLGAYVSDKVIPPHKPGTSGNAEPPTTHIVAARMGTAKVNEARRYKGIHIVTPEWLWTCAERWEHVEERLYRLEKAKTVKRNPPAHCSSPSPEFRREKFECITPIDGPDEQMPSTSKGHQPAMRKERTPSGRFMDTINPFLSFSANEIETMAHEVDDIFNESESSSTDDEEEKQKERDRAARRRSSRSLSGQDRDQQQQTLEDPSTSELTKESSSSSSESSSDDDDDDNGEFRCSSDGNFHRKRKRDMMTETETEDEPLSVKFRRGEPLPSDIDSLNLMNPSSEDEDEETNEEDEWMAQALEREFLDENSQSQDRYDVR